MLSDEEKKAIEILGEFKKNGFHLLNLKYESRVSTTKHIENSIETILNLIEKQSKEIEELEREKAIYYYEWRHLEANVINKIQEYDDKEMTVNLVNRSAGKTFQQAVRNEVRKVLQSLLEKEGE